MDDVTDERRAYSEEEISEIVAQHRRIFTDDPDPVDPGETYFQAFEAMLRAPDSESADEAQELLEMQLDAVWARRDFHRRQGHYANLTEGERVKVAERFALEDEFQRSAGRYPDQRPRLNARAAYVEWQARDYARTGQWPEGENHEQHWARTGEWLQR